MDDIPRETKHIGSIIDMEEGKISSSSRSDNNIRRGIKIIPPPAPNRPFTIPAAAPAPAVFHNATNKKIASHGIFPRGAILIHKLGTQNDCQVDILQILCFVVGVLYDAIEPFGHIGFLLVLSNHVITVGGLVVTGVEHQVVAVLGVDQAVVTSLAAVSEAPIVEVGNHLAGVNTLVQTALILVAVVGVLGSQHGETLLSLGAALELGEQLLSLDLCLVLLGSGVGDLAGGVGLTTLELDQDVTNICQSVGVIVYGAITDNIVALDGLAVAGAGAAFDDGQFAFLAGLELGLVVLSAFLGLDLADQPILEQSADGVVQQIVGLGADVLQLFLLIGFVAGGFIAGGLVASGLVAGGFIAGLTLIHQRLLLFSY